MLAMDHVNSRICEENLHTLKRRDDRLERLEMNR